MGTIGRLVAASVAAICLVAGLSALADDPAAGKQAGTIVFSSNRSGPWRIWSMRPDGTGLRELTKAGPEEHDVDPAFAADGKTLWFTSTRGGKSGVWRMAMSDLKPERVCDGDQAEPAPDGKSIALRHSEALWVRDLATGQQRRLTPEDFRHPSGPAWSPDGKSIAFACRAEGDNALYVVPAAGGKPKLIYDRQGACEPHWSPDGQRLVYETETHVCAISPEGKKNRTLTYFGGVQRYGRYSPDGKSIVFCQGVSERGPWELYVIPAQGGTPTRLTEGGSDMTPDWK